MTEKQRQGVITALYGALADAEGALNALLDGGVPYEQIHMGSHGPADPLRREVPHDLPEQFWSIAVRPEGLDADQLAAHLRDHRPLALEWLRAPDLERSDPERGAMAWGHFVFDSPDSTNQQPESSGTSGTTGVISSGAFSDGAHIQRE